MRTRRTGQVLCIRINEIKLHKNQTDNYVITPSILVIVIIITALHSCNVSATFCRKWLEKWVLGTIVLSARIGCPAELNHPLYSDTSSTKSNRFSFSNTTADRRKLERTISIQNNANGRLYQLLFSPAYLCIGPCLKCSLQSSSFGHCTLMVRRISCNRDLQLVTAILIHSRYSGAESVSASGG